MIHSVRGTITAVEGDFLFVEVRDVEYQLFVSAETAERYRKSIGNVERILTFMNVTERIMELYGFASVAERALFLSLKKVDGIGPKAAIKILSHTTPEVFLGALHAHDTKVLSALPGVGKKTASKILATLESVYVPSKRRLLEEEAQKPHGDIVGALVAMGYERERAEKGVAEIITYKHYQDEDAILRNEGEILKEVIVLLSRYQQ